MAVEHGHGLRLAKVGVALECVAKDAEEIVALRLVNVVAVRDAFIEFWVARVKLLAARLVRQKLPCLLHALEEGIVIDVILDIVKEEAPFILSKSNASPCYPEKECGNRPSSPSSKRSRRLA